MCNLRLQVPVQVANDLVAAGVVADQSDTITKGLDPLILSLVVYNTVLNAVTLAELPNRVIALRNAFVSWIEGPESPDKPYTLVATGPGGTFDYQLDSPPDSEALLAFLEQINEDGNPGATTS